MTTDEEIDQLVDEHILNHLAECFEDLNFPERAIYTPAREWFNQHGSLENYPEAKYGALARLFLRKR